MLKSPSVPLIAALVTVVSMTLPGSVVLASDDVAQGLFDLSLEELLSLEVSGASRKAQKLSETAAAAFVITAADIERSGASNIPEALRMVPGMHVGQIDGNNYAVTARGSNDRYSSKMLVMIDGRTVYTPAYSGVYWDIHEIPMVDIERIEVVRGPGSALWGVNAVNAVINVVTRHADDAQGGLAVASAGDQLNHEVALRWGGTIGDYAAYRTYVQSKDRDGNQDTEGNSTQDTAEQLRLGGRLDWQLNDSDSLTLTADAYDIESGATFNILKLQRPVGRVRTVDKSTSQGYSLLGRWHRTHRSASETTFQAYIDVMDRDDPVWGEDKQTVELELQHRSLAWAGHDFIGGATVRHHDIELQGSEAQSLDNAFHDNLIASVFLQDEIDLLDNRLKLTLGAKLEHNDNSDSDLEFMPSARLLYDINSSSSVWAAVTRSVRSPAVAEQYARLSVPLEEHYPERFPDPGLPYVLTLEGTVRMKSENLTAFELGMRSQLTPELNLDLALYYNEYENLRWPKFDDISCMPTQGPFPVCIDDPANVYLRINTELANGAESEGIGAELALSWQVSDSWKLLGAYSYMDYDLLPDQEPRDGSEWDVQHLFSLQSRLDIGERTEFDAWLRYVDSVEYYDIDHYWTLDLRLSWALSDEVSLALHGKNLLEGGHAEYQSVQREFVQTEIERSFRAEVRYRF